MADLAQPTFPPEVEEFIFSLAIREDLKLAGRLLLVARRVYEWLIPHIYEVVIFRPNQECVPHQNLSPELFVEIGKHVRHMLVQTGNNDLEGETTSCIARCPNLRSLALWLGYNFTYSPEFLNNLLSLKLKYLAFRIGTFNAGLAKQGRTLPSPLSSITHLELLGEVVRVNPHQVKEYFPALTHFAINSFGFLNMSGLKEVKEVLDTFGNQLEVAILYALQFGKADSQSPTVNVAFREEDPRLVMLLHGASAVDTWHDGVKGGPGIWTVAEEAVQARRAELGR
ncbi:hypothetical protein BDN72DRAFT_848942 [Pluteus cervinus]|uniref:Uncharacterized protein n=1 Tax=Pluteus cervinus TaxID=181527 RepID=A0ACD3A982_9AGAR|nr:hypothetical protein BDN72DRAFT_848942 [Pluteus cervinus]